MSKWSAQGSKIFDNSPKVVYNEACINSIQQIIFVDGFYDAILFDFQVEVNKFNLVYRGSEKPTGLTKPAY